MRVQVDKTALAINRGGALAVSPTAKLWVLEPNGSLDRTIDPLDVEATETPAVGYTTEDGGVEVTLPLTADAEGRFPDAWFPSATYDAYMPEDTTNPITTWEAIRADDLGGRILGYAQDTVGNTGTPPALTWFETTSTTKGGALWTALTVEVTLARETVVEVSAFCPCLNNTSASGVSQMWIYRDSTPLVSAIQSSEVANEGSSARPSIVETLAPGEYTYTVRVNALAAGTARFLCDDGSGTNYVGPASLVVRAG